MIENLHEIGCEEMSFWRSYFQERRAYMVDVNEDGRILREAARRDLSIVHSFETS